MLSSPCRTPPTGPSPESATVGQSVLTRAPDGTDDVGSWACTVACTPSAATAGSTSMTYVSRSAGSAAACGLGPRGASCGASSANIRAIRAPPGGLRIVTFPCGAGNSTWSRPRDSNPGPTHYESTRRPPFCPDLTRYQRVSRATKCHQEPPGTVQEVQAAVQVELAADRRGPTHSGCAALPPRSAAGRCRARFRVEPMGLQLVDN